MKLARYWTRQPGEAAGRDGSAVRVVARGWSDESLEAARATARDLARRVAERIVSHPNERRQYGYGDRPLPEPVLREFPDSFGGGPAAVVTRNGYGSLVLNTGRLMFVDIDREDGGSGRHSVTAAVERVAARQSLAGRIYQTAAGYRVLVTNAAFPAASPESDALLKEFGADPLYMRLCRMQESFRARLSAKPWRCGMHVPPVAFPYETAEDEARFRDWERRYTAAAAPYATCRFLAGFGGAGVSAVFAELVRYHDEETRATSGLPLA